MEIGSVLLHKEFEFKNRDKGKKLLVIIGYQKDICLICKTTSKEKIPFRVKERGCNPNKNYYMISENEDWFEKDTWIQFDKNALFEIKINDLLRDKFKNKVIYKEKLRKETIRAILECILRSKDVLEQHLHLITKSLGTIIL